MGKVDAFKGILTFTGTHFQPFEPKKEAMNLTDIAHALSQNNRWNGHTRTPLSVAQHSLNVFMYVEHHRGSKDEMRQALMHDATEAYIPDLASPVKHSMTQFQELEEKIWQEICVRFDLEPEMSPLVEEADLQVFFFEYHTAMNRAENPSFHIPKPKAPFYGRVPDPIHPAGTWKHKFLEACRKLGIE